MKGTGAGAFSKSSVPDNSIILKGGVLECRGVLLKVVLLLTKVSLELGKREKKDKYGYALELGVDEFSKLAKITGIGSSCTNDMFVMIR